MLEVIRVLLYIGFTLTALLLIVVILLQEGKGGGLASAFGGAGADTFGVGAGGINRFTATLAAIFIGAAVILAATSPDSVAPRSEPAEEAPETPGDEAPDEGGTPEKPDDAPPEKQQEPK
jgi:preprotein translocase subunit SecG